MNINHFLELLLILRVFRMTTAVATTPAEIGKPNPLAQLHSIPQPPYPTASNYGGKWLHNHMTQTASSTTEELEESTWESSMIKEHVMDLGWRLVDAIGLGGLFGITHAPVLGNVLEAGSYAVTPRDENDYNFVRMASRFQTTTTPQLGYPVFHLYRTPEQTESCTEAFEGGFTKSQIREIEQSVKDIIQSNVPYFYSNRSIHLPNGLRESNRLTLTRVRRLFRSYNPGIRMIMRNVPCSLFDLRVQAIQSYTKKFSDFMYELGRMHSHRRKIQHSLNAFMNLLDDNIEVLNAVPDPEVALWDCPYDTTWNHFCKPIIGRNASDLHNLSTEDISTDPPRLELPWGPIIYRDTWMPYREGTKFPDLVNTIGNCKLLETLRLANQSERVPLLRTVWRNLYETLKQSQVSNPTPDPKVYWLIGCMKDQYLRYYREGFAPQLQQQQVVGNFHKREALRLTRDVVFLEEPHLKVLQVLEPPPSHSYDLVEQRLLEKHYNKTMENALQRAKEIEWILNKLFGKTRNRSNCKTIRKRRHFTGNEIYEKSIREAATKITELSDSIHKLWLTQKRDGFTTLKRKQWRNTRRLPGTQKINREDIEGFLEQAIHMQTTPGSRINGPITQLNSPARTTTANPTGRFVTDWDQRFDETPSVDENNTTESQDFQNMPIFETETPLHYTREFSSGIEKFGSQKSTIASTLPPELKKYESLARATEEILNFLHRQGILQGDFSGIVYKTLLLSSERPHCRPSSTTTSVPTSFGPPEDEIEDIAKARPSLVTEFQRLQQRIEELRERSSSFAMTTSSATVSSEKTTTEEELEFSTSMTSSTQRRSRRCTHLQSASVPLLLSPKKWDLGFTNFINKACE
ncbi:unnamed protein product [Cyprideis torosa]|uniref:Uncharacterized protein n=1 Tax=Cyprideis torosa TaxID=163714 RepID=A0A7R8W6I3_9CRUS|nr:unnamed protein product [Cyprideis torosa]CAG0882345.1 unnamed protein product [Cyprideis torosa]